MALRRGGEGAKWLSGEGPHNLNSPKAMSDCDLVVCGIETHAHCTNCIVLFAIIKISAIIYIEPKNDFRK